MTLQEAVRRLNRQIDGLQGKEGARVMVSMQDVGWPQSGADTDDRALYSMLAVGML